MCSSAGRAVLVDAPERGGDLVALVVMDQHCPTLGPFVTANDRIGGNVHTDQLRSYLNLADAAYRRDRVNQGVQECADDDCHLDEAVTVSGIENFWRHQTSVVPST